MKQNELKGVSARIDLQPEHESIAWMVGSPSHHENKNVRKGANRRAGSLWVRGVG